MYITFLSLGGKFMKNLMRKCATVIAGLAMVITTCTVNSACQFFLHQPELPEGAERLRRR